MIIKREKRVITRSNTNGNTRGLFIGVRLTGVYSREVFRGAQEFKKPQLSSDLV